MWFQEYGTTANPPPASEENDSYEPIYNEPGLQNRFLAPNLNPYESCPLGGTKKCETRLFSAAERDQFLKEIDETVKNAGSIGVSLVPVIGQLKGFLDLLTGYDVVEDRKLAKAETGILGLLLLIPYLKLSKGAGLVLGRKLLPPLKKLRNKIASKCTSPAAQSLLKRLDELIAKLQGIAPNRIPGGLSPEKFAEMSSVLRSRLKTATQYGEHGDDLFVQGGRAAGKTTGDIDIGIRVSKEKFDELIEARLKSLTPGSDRWKTLMAAKERGRIFAGEIGLSGIRKEIQKILGIDTDLSIILKDGLFDKPPFIPLP